MNYTLPLQNVLKYIEENITDDIELERLASISGYSVFHFHSVFQTVLGQPVMEYIRRKRILYSTKDLTDTTLSITDIAQKYGFGSHDVFTRAFKRFIGVSPSKYRKVNCRTTSDHSSNNKIKEEAKMLEFSFYERMSCSIQEKRQCIPLIEFILTLSEKASKNGLLSLEGFVENRTFFIRKTLEMILDGAEPGYVWNTMMNYIQVGKYTGVMLLERIIALEGILAIQAGEHPQLLTQKLLSYLGEELSQEVEKTVLQPNLLRDQSIDAFLEKMKNKNPMTPSSTLLEDPVRGLDKRSLQRLLRDVSIEDITLALKGAGGNTIVKVLEGLPKNSRALIVKELEIVDLVDPQSIIAAQNKIIDVALKLRTAGDIK